MYTLRSTKKGIPCEVENRKLKRGEKISLQNSDGVIVMKWKDKRDLYYDMKIVLRKLQRGEKQLGTKTKVVIDYNEGKFFIDCSEK